MIKRLFLLAGFLLIGYTAQAQYRALTISGNSGVGLTEQTTFYGASTYLHYDVNNDWFVSNWNGISYDARNPYQQWVSSEVSANRYFSETFSIGAGIQYRYTFEEDVNDFYAVIKISKTLRFD